LLQAQAGGRETPIGREVLGQPAPQLVAADRLLAAGDDLGRRRFLTVAGPLVVAAPVRRRVAEPHGAEHRLLQVQADVALVGVADPAMQLDAALGDL